MVLHSVVVGFFTAVTQLLEPEAVRKAVADSVPSTFQELNLKAFEKGHDYGVKSLVFNPHSQELEPVIYAQE